MLKPMTQKTSHLFTRKAVISLLSLASFFACSESESDLANDSSSQEEATLSNGSTNENSKDYDEGFEAGAIAESEYSYDGSQEAAGTDAPPLVSGDSQGSPESTTVDNTIADNDQDETEIEINDFVDTSEDTLSTFSVDVDTASYTMTRRSLNEGNLPSADRVRVEEFVNFFNTDDLAPEDLSTPFNVNLESAPSPFGEDLHLMRIGVKGFEVAASDRKGANLVFLVDVSGSMNQPSKLGLVKYSLMQLLRSLRDEDTLSIVTYASRDEVVLPPTPVSHRGEILEALARLEAGGSTAGADGINTAYELAQDAFIDDGINRVVLCTDGDFNVGVRDEALVELVESWRDRGVFLSVLGYGNPNRFNDSFLEQLSNRAEGNYSFIDSRNEALRVLGQRLVGNLQVIAKDVKIQVEFNPAQVSRFRLIGYENRILNHSDFTNDQIDAGEIGSGHTVIALYEVALQNEESAQSTDSDQALATVRIRHKDVEDGVDASSIENEYSFNISHMGQSFEDASQDLRFVSAVTEFAEILRNSPHVDEVNFDRVIEIASNALAWIDGDPQVDRAEFVDLVRTAQNLWESQD
jgi:Ca-activated chloride channel family protein